MSLPSLDLAPRSRWRYRPLDRVQVPAKTVTAILIAITAAIIVVWYGLFAWRGTNAIVAASHGLVQSTLLASFVSMAFVAGTARMAGLSFADFGISGHDVRGGVATWVVAYAGVQLILLAASLLSGRGIHEGDWFTHPVGSACGSMIAQVVGTSLVEESVFRGFLFRQCLVRMRDPRSLRSLITAAAIAAVPFSLWHIPQRLSLGLDAGDLALNLTFVWLGGIVAAYLYVRTRNLMMVMALHALFNDPAPLFASPVPAQVALGIVALLFAALAGRRRLGRMNRLEQDRAVDRAQIEGTELALRRRMDGAELADRV